MTALQSPPGAASTFGKFFLPGPTDVHPDVLAAQLRPMIGHRSKGMDEMLQRMAPQLAALARTTRPVLVGTTSATGFMEMAVRRGRPLFDAILESRVIRLRPILLTAAAAMLSAIPITLDPIFSGLGWSLIFGLVASTLFTLFVIPATYWLLRYTRNPVPVD